ncbi:glycine cleavage T protein (aminomethyl transferase) [Stappia sp. 22II-S9-Z10]|nr:glycine cleavage T protein (aminomethyl transferase) [Stappia sp. 22II-S9-Z10]
MAIALTDRSLILVGGPDRLHFLDGLLSCHTADLEPGGLVYGALLTPQGKVLTDLFVHARADDVVVDLPAAVRDDVLRRLTLYKLRAAVTVEALDGTVLVGDDVPGGAPDPRAADGALGLRGIGPAEAAADGPAVYDAARIAAGVPDAVVDFELGNAFPHDANMDITGGVDFHKGCFVGQEVVSRMRHRGTARRRTVIVTADAPLPATGTALTVGTREVGRLGTVAGNRGLALVRIDRTDGTAEANGVPVTLTPPPGASFTFAAPAPATVDADGEAEA